MVSSSPRKLNAEHGIVCRLPGERFGYFGWPTVARLDDGTLLVASSGLRAEHVCPFGKTVLNVSKDDARTWSKPRVIQDSMIDDRDAGIVNLGGKKLLVSWFRSDTRKYVDHGWIPAAERETWPAVFAKWTDASVNALLGSWVALSNDAGATWGEPVRVPVSAPHGPIPLKSGDLLYLGKQYKTWDDMSLSMIAAARSADGGSTWEQVGTVPVCDKTDPANYHEPHVVELPSGRLLGMIRIQGAEGKALDATGITEFSLMQTESDDGGRTWSKAKPLGLHGSPPHLLRHSSGVLVLTYGYRQEPYGQRVAFSRDDGATWDHDWIIRDDGPDGDLGYPATVELGDGSLFTVCYQKAAAGEKCSLLWSRWSLPKEQSKGSHRSKRNSVMSSQIVLALDAKTGNPRNSEGSFVTLKDGRILFAYTRFNDGDGADHSPADIAGRFSADGGRTWSGRDRILVSNEGGCNVMSVTLLRLRDGRLAMFYLHKVAEGTDCRPYVRFSCDEGETWSERSCCAAFPGYFCQLNDQAVQLASGRIVVPVSCHTRITESGAVAAGESTIGMFFSDDGGGTWCASRDWWAPARANHGVAEPVVVERKDGDLYCCARTKLNRQWESISQDGGETWSPPRPSRFRSPQAPMTIKRIPATGHLLAVWNDLTPRWGVPKKKLVKGWANDTSWGRTPLVAAISKDKGRTWRCAKAIETDPDRGFCYTAIHFTDDAVLLAYCCGSGKRGHVCKDLCVRRIDMDELRG